MIKSPMCYNKSEGDMMRNYLYAAIIIILMSLSVYFVRERTYNEKEIEELYVVPFACHDETFRPNIDILIETSTYKGEINTIPSTKYISTYPLSTLSYQEEDYISYSAYVSNSDLWEEAELDCGMQFSENNMYNIKKFKVVLFDEFGNEIYKSEVIELQRLSFYEARRNVLYFDQDSISYDFTSYVKTANSLILIGIITLAILTSFIEILIGAAIKIKTRHFVLTVLSISFVVNVIIYINTSFYVGETNYDGMLSMSKISHILIILFLSLVEFHYYRYRLKKYIPTNTIRYYYVISHILFKVIPILILLLK